LPLKPDLVGEGSECVARQRVVFGSRWRHFVRRTRKVEEGIEVDAGKARLGWEGYTLEAEKRHTGPAGLAGAGEVVGRMHHRADLVDAGHGRRRHARERMLEPGQKPE
jgi:hypothetical protein